MAAPNFKLDNLTAILDYNHLQNDDSVDDIMPIHPVVDKWQAFGWHVIEIDGHDMTQVVDALEKAKAHQGAPTMIVANTVKGKGVSYMENVCEWHGKAPCQEEADRALEELRR
jgi:transketolase